MSDNSYISFVKKYMAEHNISYREAMTAAKTSYHSTITNKNSTTPNKKDITTNEDITKSKIQNNQTTNIPIIKSKSRKNVQLAFDDVFAEDDNHPEDDEVIKPVVRKPKKDPSVIKEVRAKKSIPILTLNSEEPGKNNKSIKTKNNIGNGINVIASKVPGMSATKNALSDEELLHIFSDLN